MPTDKYLSLTFNPCPLFFPSVYQFVLSPLYLLASFLFLSIHTYIFLSLFMPPTDGVFVIGKQKLFFKPLSYPDRGRGGLPESRTEGILCWTRGRGTVWRTGERVVGGSIALGGDKNITHTGKLCAGSRNKCKDPGHILFLMSLWGKVGLKAKKEHRDEKKRNHISAEKKFVWRCNKRVKGTWKSVSSRLIRQMTRCK